MKINYSPDPVTYSLRRLVDLSKYLQQHKDKEIYLAIKRESTNLLRRAVWLWMEIRFGEDFMKNISRAREKVEGWKGRLRNYKCLNCKEWFKHDGGQLPKKARYCDKCLEDEEINQKFHAAFEEAYPDEEYID